MLLPWVRMHAAKDYLHMVEVLEEYPDVHATFNVAPSLVEQLQAYIDGIVVDRAWNVSLRERLSVEDKRFIDSLFYNINRDNTIRSYPRYWQLLKLKEAAGGDLDLLGETYWRDLIAWFNLAWFDPGWIQRDPELRALVGKGSRFTLEDVSTVLAKQRQMMGNTLPAYRRLQRRGQVELSVSPYYHPILPLLIDSNVAMEPSPWLSLPAARFQHREDALEQLKRAVAYHEATFGRPPAGLWPSEGAVSQGLVELLQEVPEIYWLATDEAILARSFGRSIQHNGWGYVTDPRFLYRPYWAGSGEGRVAMVFRDHYLSDRIGFAYQGLTGRQGAEDLMFRFVCIHEMVKDDPEPSLVSIILDGENCWEGYERNGETFLRSLYEMLSAEGRVRTVTVSEFLTEFPPRVEIPQLATGSWINGNLETWIGEQAQNRAWEYLYRTRETLAEAEIHGGIPLERLEKARNQMMAAEGSDWFWWYYSHNVSEQDEVFDGLFRHYLSGVHRALGIDPPEWLGTPIFQVAPKLTSRAPSGRVHPPLTEGDMSPTAWAEAGYVDPKASTGAMQQGSALLKRLYFGYDECNLFLRLESHGSLSGYLIEAYVDPLEASGLARGSPGTGGALVSAVDARPSLEIAIRTESRSIELSRWQEDTGWIRIQSGARLVVGETVIEAAVPLENLGMKPEMPAGLTVVLFRDNVVVQRLPEEGQVVVVLSAESRVPGSEQSQS